MEQIMITDDNGGPVSDGGPVGDDVYKGCGQVLKYSIKVQKTWKKVRLVSFVFYQEWSIYLLF